MMMTCVGERDVITLSLEYEIFSLHGALYYGSFSSFVSITKIIGHYFKRECRLDGDTAVKHSCDYETQ
jgi:hypothetical protein